MVAYTNSTSLWTLGSLCSLVMALPSCHSEGTHDGNNAAQGGVVSSVGGHSSAPGGGATLTGGASSSTTGTLSNVGGASSTATGGNQSAGGQLNTGATTTGSSFDVGIGGSSTGGTLTGGASTIGASTGGSFNTGGASTTSTLTGGASTGGATHIGGSFTGGASTGNGVTGGASAIGTSAGGASTGGSSGTGDCVNVCELYGPVCCVTDLVCVKPGASCIVDVLEGRIGTTYEYTDLEQKFAALPQNVRFSFTDTDIAWAAAHPDLGAHFEFHMTAQWSSLHNTDVTEYMDGTPFRFSCNGQSLFVGVFYLIYGAAALDTPVMHPDRDTDNSMILRLGAWQGAWMSYVAVGKPGERERIDRPELRSVLCQRGALRVLDESAVPPSN